MQIHQKPMGNDGQTDTSSAQTALAVSSSFGRSPATHYSGVIFNRKRNFKCGPAWSIRFFRGNLMQLTTTSLDAVQLRLHLRVCMCVFCFVFVGVFWHRWCLAFFGIENHLKNASQSFKGYAESRYFQERIFQKSVLFVAHL